jgi:hypothetical protein
MKKEENEEEQHMLQEKRVSLKLKNMLVNKT